MRCAFRCTLSAVLLSIFLLLASLSLLLEQHFEDLWHQYDATDYAYHYLRTFLQHDPIYHSVPQPELAESQDKVIVMARLAGEDTRWVDEHLWDWQNAIYTVNPSATTPNDTLSTSLNKGHEAMAYLTYIIDHYHNLPSIIAFLHSHRSGFLKAWHTDAPLHDNVFAMQHLQLEAVEKHGYVNLRCNWNPGCLVAHRINEHITEGIWEEVFSNTSTQVLQKSSSSPSDLMMQGSIKKENAWPTEVGVACCAQFAVSRTQVLRRPIDDYLQFQRWIIETELDDAHSGRVMEFLWHIIFGKEAVHCPIEDVCYCEIYGRC